MSSYCFKECSNNFWLWQQLQSSDAWKIIQLKDHHIIPGLDRKTSKQFYNARRKCGLKISDDKNILRLERLNGFLAKHETSRSGGYLAFAWKKNPSVSPATFKSNQSKIHGKNWELIPDLEAQARAKEICKKKSSESELSAVMLDYVIKVIHSGALGEAKARNQK